MGAAGKFCEHAASVVRRTRLAEDATIENDLGVRSDDDGGTDGTGGGELRFGFGEAEDQVVWRLAGEGRFVDGRRKHGEMVACVAKDFSATDVTGVNAIGTLPGDVSNTSFTASQQATILYSSVHHQITPQLTGSLLGQFQYSSFTGGVVDNQSERYFLLGLNLSYQFTPNFSTEIGYNYDKLNSDISGRTFDRNRVYIGVTGRY